MYRRKRFHAAAAFRAFCPWLTMLTMDGASSTLRIYKKGFDLTTKPDDKVAASTLRKSETVAPSTGSFARRAVRRQKLLEDGIMPPSRASRPSPGKRGNSVPKA